VIVRVAPEVTCAEFATLTVIVVPLIAVIFADVPTPVPEILSPTVIPEVEATEITVAAEADEAAAVVVNVLWSAPSFAE